MTNEEAREIIKQFRDRQGNSSEDVEAFDMAIKALEQQPCEDCIDRKAVKDMLTEEWTKYVSMELDINLSFILDKINELPSVTSKASWIPVSERLPEEDGLYLVTDVSKYFGAYSPYVLKREKASPSNCVKWGTIVAWMPLPERYKAEEEEG